jgi:hypothetical protein
MKRGKAWILLAIGNGKLPLEPQAIAAPGLAASLPDLQGYQALSRKPAKAVFYWC